jgi:hypothetical protein
MLADLGFPLTRDYVRTASVLFLRTEVKKWLKRENPICLKHPLGFYVALLGRNETEEWRFHFWPKESRAVIGIPPGIHTHDYRVESRILQGKLINTIYNVALVKTGGQPIYVVSYGGDRYASETSNYLRQTTERVEPTVQRRDTLHCGDMYHIESHTYHKVTVPEQLETSTLVCMHGRSSGPVRVVGLDGYPETISFKREHNRALVFADRLST